MVQIKIFLTGVSQKASMIQVRLLVMLATTHPILPLQDPMEFYMIIVAPQLIWVCLTTTNEKEKALHTA